MSDMPPGSSASSNPNVPGWQQIREFNDRGTLWLLEDPANLRDLLQILSPELAARLDIRQAERINRSFIAEDLKKEESDLIFRIAYRADDALAGTDVLIFVLLEHQSKPDPLMGLRLLSYLLALWEVQRREAKDANIPASEVRLSPVVPIVFYTGTDTWDGVPGVADLMDLPAGLTDFIPAWKTLFLNLSQTDPADLTRYSTAMGYALRVLQAEREPFATLEQVLEEALRGLEGLAEEQAGQWLRVACYLYLLVSHRRSRQEAPTLLQTLEERAKASKFHERTEANTIMITLAQELEARGEARGVALGEARGVALGEARGETKATRQSVELVITTRFGPIPPSLMQALESADLPTLQNWLQQAVQATTLEDVGILPASS